MTILAIEMELNRQSPTVSLTDGWSFDDSETVSFDADLLFNTIVNRGAEFCVLYPEPDFFKMMSDRWWQRWSPNFLKWLKVMEMEYNPIENYDRNEVFHDESELKQTGTDTMTGDVSAFDSSSYQPRDKNTDTKNLTDNNESDHTGRVHGNIGVTTSQQMIESELALRRNNVYNMMSDCFIKEMLIAVY